MEMFGCSLQDSVHKDVRYRSVFPISEVDVPCKRVRNRSIARGDAGPG